MTHYFLEKTTKLTQDTYAHEGYEDIKDVLNVPKISVTHFPPKSKLQSFAFAWQYSIVVYATVQYVGVCKIKKL